MSTDLAERLEKVRAENGCRTLLAFRAALHEVPGFTTSYGAMRNYHLGYREPPVAYLVAIMRRFNVHPSWLLTGGYDL